jgi:hypothetical protein
MLNEIDVSFESEHDKKEPKLLLCDYCQKEYLIPSYTRSAFTIPMRALVHQTFNFSSTTMDRSKIDLYFCIVLKSLAARD